MNGLFGRAALSIAAGQAVSGVAHEPSTLRVLAGRIWLTVEGVPDDHWLQAGESIALLPGRLVVLEADRASRVALSAASPDKRRRMRFIPLFNC